MLNSSLILALIDGDVTEQMAFFGKLHPVFVHAPIGFILALLLVEMVAGRRTEGRVVTLRRLLWVTTAISGFVTTFSGWTEAEHTRAVGDVVFRHRWFAVSLMVVLIVTAAFELFGRSARTSMIRRIGLLVSLVLVTATGHNGGVLTHGQGHLANEAPAWLRPLLGEPTPAVAVESGDVDHLFTAIAESCYSCHGPDQQKGDLRLDTKEGLMSVVEPGFPTDSELFRRVTLPMDDSEAMPPDGVPFDEAATIEMLRWIRSGAPLEEAAEASAEMEQVLLDLEAALQGARTASGAAIQESGSDGALEVSFAFAGSVPTPTQAASLAPLADRIVDLNFAGQPITAILIAALPVMPALTHLHLERTKIQDDVWVELERVAPNLRWLNVYNTKVQVVVWSDWLAKLDRIVAHGTNLMVAMPDWHPTTSIDLDVPDITRDIRIEEPFSRSSPRMILAADPGKKRVALVREIAIGQHELVWERPIEVCRDLQLLGNKVLYQDTESRVRALDLKSGDLAWSFDAAAHWGQDAEIQSFCRTYDGLYMVARSSPPQLLEFDTDGVVHREIELQVQDMVGPSNLSMVRPTYLNGYVVTHPDSGMVREYKRDGELLWRYEVPLFGIDSVEGQGPDAWGNQCYLALSRSETHTMLTTGNGHGLIEVAKDGTVQKRIQQSDLPDVQLAWTTTIQLLEDDQLVLGNRHAGPDQPQLIEFDIDWNVTWTFNNHDLFSDSMTCAVVIEDTKVQNAWR